MLQYYSLLIGIFLDGDVLNPKPLNIKSKSALNPKSRQSKIPWLELVDDIFRRGQYGYA